MKKILFSEFGTSIIISFFYLILTFFSLYHHYETSEIICWMGFCTFRIIAEMNKDRR